MKEPVLASTSTRSVVAGAGQGCGVAVYGPQEDGKEPAMRTDQTGVAAATTNPPEVSSP